MSSENEDTPTNDGPLSMSDAVKAFTASEAPEELQQEQSDEELAQPGNADDELPVDDTGEDEGDPDADADQADPDAEADGDDEPESEQGRFVADNARVKLPDGSFTTVAELKEGTLRRDDYTRKTQELAVEKQTVHSEREQTTQLKLQVEEVRDFSIAVLEHFMPKKPDDALLTTDPFAHMRLEREYNARVEQLEFLKAEKAWQKQQADVQENAEARQKANTEWASLIEKMPELKDETRRNAVVTDLFKHGKTYGFEEQEVRAALAFDHRQALVLSDAAKWRKLQAAKAKTLTKVEGRPPVQTSGKRVNADGQKNRQAKVAMSRLEETGSFKDGLKAYLASE